VTAVVAAPARLDAAVGWQVEFRERTPGLTRVTPDGLDLSVRLGDRGPVGDVAGAGPRSLGSLLVAELSAVGTVSVVARYAPPALVLSDAGVTLLPADGGGTATAVLAEGDLLVMCSAGLLEAGPAAVVELLRAGSRPAREADPRWLVRALLRDSLTGAAVVARRRRVETGPRPIPIR
jgi:hypothetical protein